MDWLELSRFVFKPIAIYLAALAVVRLVGKRALGQLTLFDLVIMAGIGDVIVVVGLEQSVSFQKGLVILGVITGLELFLSLASYHSRFFSRLFEGKPTILIKDGMLLEDNLLKEHLTLADLRQELRKQGVAKISLVSQAVFEACGKLSIILKEEEQPSNLQLQQELVSIREELNELREILKGAVKANNK